MSDIMDLIVVYPDPPPSDLARTLDLAGYRWKACMSAEEAARNEPVTGWAGAVVGCADGAEAAPAGRAGLAAARARRRRPARRPRAARRAVRRLLPDPLPSDRGGGQVAPHPVPWRHGEPPRDGRVRRALRQT